MVILLSNLLASAQIKSKSFGSSKINAGNWTYWIYFRFSLAYVKIYGEDRQASIRGNKKSILLLTERDRKDGINIFEVPLYSSVYSKETNKSWLT